MNDASNGEISRNRGKEWVKKMVDSKYEYATRPTRIRDIRVKKKKSQEEIATACDLSHTTYGDIERGKRLVRKETAERIAKLLSTSVDKLFEKSGKKFLAKRGEK